MSKRVPVGSALALAALLAVAGRGYALCVPLPGCPVQITWEDKVVTCYRPEVRTRQVPVVVNRTVCHEEAVVEKYAVPVPVWSQEKRTVYVYKEAPKEVEREVTCVLPTPPCPPPCDGHCGHGCDICRPAPATYTQKIKTVECQPAPEKVEFVENVCTYKAEEHTRVVKKQVARTIPETVLREEVYCELVPYQVTVKVPVCMPTPCGH